MAERHGLHYRNRKAPFDFGMLRKIGDTAATQIGGLDQTAVGRSRPTIPIISMLFPAPLGPMIAVSEPRENSPLS
jgi:hypothetical protein